MHETGASAEDARDHVKRLISEAWKKLNEARLADSPFNRIFVEIATNLARVSQFMLMLNPQHPLSNQRLLTASNSFDTSRLNLRIPLKKNTLDEDHTINPLM
ncbi:hypothetical protein ACSBR1_034633 [Camellia fascicularis]